jgi:hypothetical protein
VQPVSQAARVGRWAAFGAAVLINLIVVYWPSTPGTAGVPHVDKVVHLVVFALVAWTGRRAGVPWRLLAVALVVHAVTSEIVQGALLSGRSGDPWDVLADVIGVAAGLALGRDHPRSHGIIDT